MKKQTFTKQIEETPRPSSDFLLEEAALRNAKTLFSSSAVNNAQTRIWGRVAEHVFVENAFRILDRSNGLDSASKTNQNSCSEFPPANSNVPSLSLTCPFLGCDAVRVYEGGRPLHFAHLDACSKCGCRIAIEASDIEAVKLMISRHLL